MRKLQLTGPFVTLLLATACGQAGSSDGSESDLASDPAAAAVAAVRGLKGVPQELLDFRACGGSVEGGWVIGEAITYAWTEDVDSSQACESSYSSTRVGSSGVPV